MRIDYSEVNYCTYCNIKYSKNELYCSRYDGCGRRVRTTARKKDQRINVSVEVVS